MKKTFSIGVLVVAMISSCVGGCCISELLLGEVARGDVADVTISEENRIKLIGTPSPGVEYCPKKNKDGTIIYYAVERGNKCDGGDVGVGEEKPDGKPNK